MECIFQNGMRTYCKKMLQFTNFEISVKTSSAATYFAGYSNMPCVCSAIIRFMQNLLPVILTDTHVLFTA